MDKFTLTIELGNEAMQTGADIATALREVADKMDSAYGHHAIEADNGRIRDLNGNTVGKWWVK